MGVFKGFLSRALHICSENYLAQEIDFLINVFAENGHSITVLEKVTKKYMNNITLRFRKIAGGGGGAGIVGALETLVYINNRGDWNSTGVGNFRMY